MWGEANDAGDSIEANRLYGIIQDSGAQLLECGNGDAIAALCDDGCIWGRIWSAVLIKDYDRDLAVKHLTKIANGTDAIPKFAAEQTLIGWRNE